MTRPRAASERFFSRLPRDLQRCLRPVYAPLMEIHPIGGEIEFNDAGGVIFTSGHGVAAASERTDQRDLHAFCVGQTTTRRATQAGWNAKCMGETGQDLVRRLIDSG
jgi:uroporphyrinogen-III synthase